MEDISFINVAVTDLAGLFFDMCPHLVVKGLWSRNCNLSGSCLTATTLVWPWPGELRHCSAKRCNLPLFPRAGLLWPRCPCNQLWWVYNQLWTTLAASSHHSKPWCWASSWRLCAWFVDMKQASEMSWLKLTDPQTFSLLMTRSTMKIFSSEKVRIQLPWHFKSLKKWQHCSCIWSVNRGLFTYFKLLSPSSLMALNTVATKMLFPNHGPTIGNLRFAWSRSIFEAFPR